MFQVKTMRVETDVVDTPARELIAHVHGVSGFSLPSVWRMVDTLKYINCELNMQNSCINLNFDNVNIM